MTPKQIETIDKWFKAVAHEDMLMDIHAEDDYEFKRWEVRETEWGKVEVYSVVGMKGDEGTAASLFCRNYRQIFIGKNGGVVTYGPFAICKKEKLQGFRNALISGYRH